MSTTPQNNDENQEIDLSAISKKIGSFFEDISTKIFRAIIFVKRNILIISILMILGIGIGFYFDKTIKVYNNQIIVTPNFTSNEYLYSKIDLINSKVKEKDTLFLKNVVGIKDTENFGQIKISPITDVYQFIGSNPLNFEFIKLLAEDGDLKKIVDEKLTSKNYAYHSIEFETKKLTSNEKTIKPILNYLNNSDYFKLVQKQYINNIRVKMIENDSIIGQINGILNSFSKSVNGSQKSDKLVYYNENTQLNEVIKTKEGLITEQGLKRIELVNVDKIIKDNSSTINIKNTSNINGKLKLFLPVLFVFLFLMFGYIKSFYKKQLIKANSNS